MLEPKESAVQSSFVPSNDVAVVVSVMDCLTVRHKTVTRRKESVALVKCTDEDGGAGCCIRAS